MRRKRILSSKTIVFWKRAYKIYFTRYLFCWICKWKPMMKIWIYQAISDQFLKFWTFLISTQSQVSETPIGLIPTCLSPFRDRKNTFWLAAKIFWAKMAVNFFIPICHFKLYFLLGEPLESICLDSRPLCCHNWSSKRKSMIYFW